MYTKKDKGKAEGDLKYNNKGSSSRLLNYLSGNNEKLSDENLFFTLSKENLSKEEAQQLIDTNVKGLSEKDVKFYSLTLNPSNHELAHINNDKNKLLEFTRQSMREYAANFVSKDVKAEDVVWTAIIHDIRYYTNLDKRNYDKLNPGKQFPYSTIEQVNKWKNKNPKEVCLFEKEAVKTGNNMHVHIIVSRRDSEMKRSLTIEGKGSKQKFSLVGWQEKNQRVFQKTFNYRVGEDVYLSAQKKRLSVEIKNLYEKRGVCLDENKIFKILERTGNRGEVLANIRKLSRELGKSKPINDFYHFIEHGKDIPEILPPKLTLPKEVNVLVENTLILLGEESNYNYDLEQYKTNIGKRRKKRRNLPPPP